MGPFGRERLDLFALFVLGLFELFYIFCCGHGC